MIDKDWMFEIYNEVADNRDDRSLDILFQKIDILCYEEKFDIIDKILLEFDFSKVSPTLLVGILSITNPIKTFLLNRSVLM